MDQKKSFVTVFDKDCEEYAETLMSLVSNDNINNIKRIGKEFRKDANVVSGEYVLTIGDKVSANNRQNFNDLYNRYGIHIGFNGTKAWISCELFNGWQKSLVDFYKENNALRGKNGLNTDVIGVKDRKAIIIRETLHQLVPPDPVLKTLSRVIGDTVFSRENYKKQLYRYAVILFYQDYLHDFLRIKEEQSEEQSC